MIKKIAVADLEIGMFVHDFNTPWVNHPFLTNQKLLRSARHIDLVRAQGIDAVYIDTRQGGDSPRAVAVAEADLQATDAALDTSPEAAPRGEGGQTLRTARAEEVPFEEELRKAREVYSEACQVVQDLFTDARAGASIDAERTRDTVAKMIASIFRNEDALLSLSRLKNFDRYTFQHSVNVTVLSLNLGRRLGILDRELLGLGIGAVLHDLGKICVPGELIRKAGRLSDREFDLIKTHAAHGARLLLHTAGIPDECATVALNHHERYDGSGYPRGLAGLHVGKYGLITAIADVYDAMTSQRVYQRRYSPQEVLKRTYEWAGSHFHPIYAQKFIQCIGIYPIGSTVRLDSGEIGVVCRQNHDQLVRPWVRLAADRQGQRVRVEDIDLRAPDRNGDRPHERSIEAVLDPPPPEVDVDALLAARTAPESALTVVLG